MKSFVKSSNGAKYFFEFIDSHYSFDEDLEFTLSEYTSIKQISENDLKSLLFILHSYIHKFLFQDQLDIQMIKSFDLSEYGSGPQYDDPELFFVLGGDYEIQEIHKENITLMSLKGQITLVVDLSEIDMFFTEDFSNLDKGVNVNFDGSESFICINQKKRETFKEKLLKDLERLNILLNKLSLETINLD